MASIERRQIRGQERFLVRYRDPSGKQKARTFVSEKAAVDYEAEVRTDMRRGAYLDPQAGQMKVAPWSEKWIAAQGHLKPSTRTRYRGLLKVQILPRCDVTFGFIRANRFVPFPAAVEMAMRS